MSDTSYKIEKIELNSSGVKAMLQSQEIMDLLESVAPQLGEVDSSYVGFDRCHVVIKGN